MPSAHPWTRCQKWLIICTAVVGLAICSALIYGYERYYRGPGQEMLYGTWQFDGLFYVEFRQDNGFAMFELNEPHSLITKGRWYAGGKFLYMGFPLSFRPDGNTLEVWRIEEISREQISVRYCRDCMEHVFERVHSASTHAANQATQRTASKPATDVLRVCHPHFHCVASCSGLAVADLGSR